MDNEIRVDKWIWATRIFKTRTIAAEACKKGRVMIKNITIKPSRMVKIGDIIQIKKTPIIYSFKVIGLTDKRIGAKLVPLYVENVTSQDQYEILESHKLSGYIDRDRGSGRPTKKERRDLDLFTASDMIQNFDLDDEEF